MEIEWRGARYEGREITYLQIGSILLVDERGNHWALDAMAEGLRALNDAPLLKMRVWMNIYPNGSKHFYDDPGMAKCCASRGIGGRIAVPCVITEEK